MADELIEGMLGGEDEGPGLAASETPAGAEAFAAAIAAIASRQDPEVARRTAEFLSDQSRLLRAQTKHLEDEHASRLLHLRLAVAAAKRKRYADRMRNALYTCMALIATGVLVAAVRMTAEAMSDHSLVVEDFTVPADFAARGASGQALAEDLASRVAAIRRTANVHSLVESNGVRADQASVLKVQIPETGVSVDELERFLHRWLGHQTQLSGEVREEADGQVSILLHIAGADPIAVKGPGSGLSRLMQATAEQAFAIFDINNYCIYLVVSGRQREALDALERYLKSPALASSSWSPQARQAFPSLLAAIDPDRRRALSEALIVTEANPRLTVGWYQVAQLSAEQGHYQAAVDFYRRTLATKIDDQAPELRNSNATLVASARVFIDQMTGDFTALEADGQTLNEAQIAHGRASNWSDVYAEGASTAAALHDEPLSRKDLLRAGLATGPADASVLQARWQVSSAAGDWPQALKDAQQLVTQAQAPAALMGHGSAEPPTPDSGRENGDADASRALAGRGALDDPSTLTQTLYRPWLAYAEVMTGDTAAATALIAQTPMDCYLCIRTRGVVAAAAGDAAGADHWFAEAVSQAPGLPMAHFQWGEALLARGDLPGAAREFALAHEKGPHFADPLKGSGDVLVRQGQPKQALAKYDEALRYAPNWAALKAARAAAAAGGT